jgi:hypothetical protein
MRRVAAILSAAAVVLTAAGLAAQAKPSFAGEWKIVADPAADGGGGRGGGAGVDLAIKQDDTAMTLEYRGAVQAPAPVKLTYKLDGSVSKSMMAGRGSGAPTEQVSKAMWAGNHIVVITTTGAGDEKRTFSMDGGYLVVETSAPARNGRAANITKVIYQRYERGFGG